MYHAYKTKTKNLRFDDEEYQHYFIK